MSALTDFFSKEEVYDILDNSENKIGVDIVTYKFLKIPNTINLTTSRTYTVSVKHRILVKGPEWEPGGPPNGFNHYPILLRVQSGIKSLSDKGAKVSLRKIFPKTINANVEQTSNQSSESSNTRTNQTSSGSSMSNVNTFGIQISGGFFAEIPTGSIGLDYSHSWDNATSRSRSLGRDHSSGVQAAAGEEMSVKDWSAYASVQNFDQTSEEFVGEVVHWNWGQTNPWNIFKFSQTGSGANIVLPEDVVSRLLYYGPTDDADTKSNILLPPSDLSLFGLDFTMTAEWQITFPKKVSSIETLKLEHNVTVLHGSHSMIAPSGGKGEATLNASLVTGYINTYTQQETIDIGQYALVPLGSNQRIGSGVGFKDYLFDIPPSDAKTEFKIFSKRNNVLVTGTGFDSAMNAVFKRGYSGPPTLVTVFFKVADMGTEYALVLKHWKGLNSSAIVLNCTINNIWKTTIHVDYVEGQDASNNLNQLDLRNYDLESANFNDFLFLGMNEIKIEILPRDSSLDSLYTLSALSIEG